MATFFYFSYIKYQLTGNIGNLFLRMQKTFLNFALLF